MCMRSLPLLCLLFSAFALAQEQPLPQPGLPPEYRPPVLRNDDDDAVPRAAAKVAPDAAVITIHGVCNPPASSGSAAASSCQTIITRAQFEKLTEALLKNMKLSRKRQLASAYPELLAMAHEAEKRGLETSERFQQRMAYARIQILSRELVDEIEEQTDNVPAKEIEDYYRSHPAEFEFVTLQRIFIPNRKRTDPLPKDNATQAFLADAMTKLAEQIRAEAVAGADFASLEKKVYAAAGMTDVPPNTSLGQVHPGDITAARASVLDLNPGEISPVISDSTGHYIYKLDAKQVQPLADVSDGIRKTLATQHRAEEIQSIQQPVTADFNTSYFGPMQKRNGPADSKSDSKSESKSDSKSD